MMKRTLVLSLLLFPQWDASAGGSQEVVPPDWSGHVDVRLEATQGRVVAHQPIFIRVIETNRAATPLPSLPVLGANAQVYIREGAQEPRRMQAGSTDGVPARRVSWEPGRRSWLLVIADPTIEGGAPIPGRFLSARAGDVPFRVEALRGAAVSERIVRGGRVTVNRLAGM